MNVGGQCDGDEVDRQATRADLAWIVIPSIAVVAVVANQRVEGKVIDSGGRSIDTLTYLLAIAAVMGLTLFRSWPRLALVAVVVPSLAYSILDYPSHPGQFVGGVAILLAFLRGAPREAVLVSVLAVLGSVVAAPRMLSDDSLRSMGRVLTFLIPTIPVAIGVLVSSYRQRIELLAEQLVLTRQAHAVGIERDSAKQRVAIARDLHDTVGHSIAVISVQSGAALSILDADADADTEATRQALLAINDSCRQAMSETKHALSALRGGSSQTAPSIEATLMTAKSAGLQVELRQSGVLADLNVRIRDAIQRLAQESLTNALRHAEAATVGVTVNVADQAVRFEFTNDGEPVGINGVADGTGSGLRGMAERVSELGGRFEAGETDGGFRVFAEIPLSVGER